MTTSNRIICGVDPGRWGGIAFLGKKPSVVAMPAATGHDYHITAITSLLYANARTESLLVIERVTRPAALTRCLGIFEGIGNALEYRVETVRPQEWKKHFQLHGSDKRQSMELAGELFPDLKDRFRRVTMDDGLADAILIAQYGKDVLW